MTPVRLEPAALRSRVKHSTTEPLRSLKQQVSNDHEAYYSCRCILSVIDRLFKGALFVCFVALRPKSTAMVMAGRSVHLTTLFSWASLNKQLTSTSCKRAHCNSVTLACILCSRDPLTLNTVHTPVLVWCRFCRILFFINWSFLSNGFCQKDDDELEFNDASTLLGH